MLPEVCRPGWSPFLGREPWTIRAQGYWRWMKKMQNASNTNVTFFVGWHLQQWHPSSTVFSSSPPRASLKWLISITSTWIIIEGLTIALHSLKVSGRDRQQEHVRNFSLKGWCAEQLGKAAGVRGCPSRGLSSTQIGFLSVYLYSQFLATVCGLLFKVMRGNTNTGGGKATLNPYIATIQ